MKIKFKTTNCIFVLDVKKVLIQCSNEKEKTNPFSSCINDQDHENFNGPLLIIQWNTREFFVSIFASFSHPNSQWQLSFNVDTLFAIDGLICAIKQFTDKEKNWHSEK